MQPGYLKLGLFAFRISLHHSPDDEQDLPLIFFRTSHLRRYFHEQDDPYAPYVTAKYSEYRAHKRRWVERMRERGGEEEVRTAEERAKIERMGKDRTEKGRERERREGECVAVERWRAPETRK